MPPPSPDAGAAGPAAVPLGARGPVLADVSGVLVDFAGTLTRIPEHLDLLRTPWERYLAVLAEESPGDYRAGARDRALERLAEAEGAAWRDCVGSGRSWTLDDILRTASVPDSAAARNAYREVFAPGCEVTAEALGALRALAARAIPIVVVSNSLWPREWILAPLRRSGAADCLADVVVSSDLPFCKPNPEIFRHALSRLGTSRPSDAVVVGDRLFEDVHGGARCGLRTVLVGTGGAPSPVAAEPTLRLPGMGALPAAIG